MRCGTVAVGKRFLRKNTIQFDEGIATLCLSCIHTQDFNRQNPEQKTPPACEEAR